MPMGGGGGGGGGVRRSLAYQSFPDRRTTIKGGFAWPRVIARSGPIIWPHRVSPWAEVAIMARENPRGCRRRVGRTWLGPTGRHCMLVLGWCPCDDANPRGPDLVVLRLWSRFRDRSALVTSASGPVIRNRTCAYRRLSKSHYISHGTMPMSSARSRSAEV